MEKIDVEKMLIDKKAAEDKIAKVLAELAFPYNDVCRVSCNGYSEHTAANDGSGRTIYAHSSFIVNVTMELENKIKIG